MLLKIQVVTVRNVTVGDASEHQYAATFPLQVQIGSGSTVEVTHHEQTNMPNVITFAEAQNLEENNYFSRL